MFLARARSQIRATPMTAVFQRRYSIGDKNQLRFILGIELKRSSGKNSSLVPDPVIEKSQKAETTIEKMWDTAESLSPNFGKVSSRFVRENQFLPCDSVDSDSEIIDFQDPIITPLSKFVDYEETDKEVVPVNKEASTLGEILQMNFKVEKDENDIDSDEFDFVLTKTPNTKSTSTISPSVSGREPTKDLQGKREKVYDLYDLTRRDSIAPRVPELEGEENVGETPTGEEATYIEDLDLDRYVLQRGNFEEAQKFLRDVSQFKTSDFPLEKRTKVVDMVARARKIIENQKTSRNFWDEFIVLRQLHEFAVLAPVHYRPVLDPQVKDSIFLLHQSNPEEWTTGKLAQRFRIKKARIEAILLLKIDEHIRRKTKPWTVNMNGDEIDYLYGEYFGLTGCGEWVGNEDDRFNIQERRWRNARISFVDDEQEDLASLARMAVRIKPSWFEMPEERPTGVDAYPDIYPDGAIIRGPLHKLWKGRFKRSENVFLDSSPIENFEEQCKMFWVKRDGSMRHVTWEERRRTFRKQQFAKSLKGSVFVTQDVLMDPVIFPTDKEEEQLLEDQKHPLVRNRRFATQKVFKENDMLRELDTDYNKIGRLVLPADQYVRGRMPWSVQQVLKKERATNVLDTIYKPLHDNFH